MPIDPLSDHLEDSPHIAIQVANGGYIVHAWVFDSESKEKDQYKWTTSVFTSVLSMTAYIERVVKNLEGPNEGLNPGDRLGNIKIE